MGSEEDEREKKKKGKRRERNPLDACAEIQEYSKAEFPLVT